MKHLTACVVLGSLLLGFSSVAVRKASSAALPTPGAEIVFVDRIYASKGRLFILSSGINDYPRPHKVKYGVADALSLAESLESRGKGHFLETHKTLLLDQKVTKRNLEDALDSIAREIRPDDTFVFYFGGVGTVAAESAETAAVPNEPKQDFYLWPVDANRTALSSTAISGKQLRSYFRRIRARNQLLILDASESSFGFESLATGVFEQDKSVTELLRVNSLFIGTDTPELEPEQLGHGLITSAVLDALSGAGDYDNNGMLNAREIEAYLYSRLRELSTKFKLTASTEVHPRTITRGSDFALGYSDKKLAALAKQEQLRKEPQGNANATNSAATTSVSSNDGDATRTSKRATPADKDRAEPRKGIDYALLIATDEYQAKDDWKKLTNPSKDAEAIKERLISMYGFVGKNVRLERNLTRKQLLNVIKEYRELEFGNPNEDQLFIFFAGHGTVDEETGDGYLVASDSPAKLTDESENRFLSLERLQGLIDGIQCAHIFVVFDACYVGKIWKLRVQPVPQVALMPRPSIIETTTVGSEGSQSKPFQLASWTTGGSAAESTSLASIQDKQQQGVYAQLSKNAYIKRKMKTRTRILFTSGDGPVYEGDPAGHSPFARAFLEALDQGGVKYDVLTTGEIYLKIDALNSEPGRGSLSGSDGDFIFIAPEKLKH